MPPDQRDKAYLWDMLDAALAIGQFVQGRTYEEYLSNRMMRGAVERHIEIIWRSGPACVRSDSGGDSRNSMALDHWPT